MQKHTNISRIQLRKRSGIHHLLLLLFLIAVVSPARFAAAQDTPDKKSGINERPRIGLALSGGGARGLAHIGVLKRLEELQIPVDYIAGTSMGSIIGALYATGRSAIELEQVVQEIDWELAFSDDTPRSLLPMRRKIDQYDYLINLELGIDRSGLRLPKGVVQGQNVHLILKDLFRSALAVDDFDELPIPFRAVASDIENNRPVILSGGDLATAIQASMAIPGVFAPVEVNGKTLVDGGVTKNLPADVVRDMGADIIIAVDISSPLLEPDELQTALDILDQLTNILTLRNLEQQVLQLTDTDILIRPDLEAFSTTGFDQAGSVVATGYGSVKQSEARLAELSVSAQQYSEHRLAIDKRVEKAFVPDYVTVVQDSGLSSEALRSRLRVKPAEELDQALLHEDVERIHGLGLFRSVNYHVQTDNGISGLIVTAKEKEWGPNYLKFGLQLEDDLESETNYNIALGIRREPVNRLGGEVTLVLAGGTDPKFSLEYFQPFTSLEDTYFMLDLSSGQFNTDWYVNEERVAEYRIRANEGSAWIGYQTNNAIDLRAGLIRSSGTANRVVGGEEFERHAEFDDGGAAIELRYDTLDSAAFSRRGHRGLLRYQKSYEQIGLIRVDGQQIKRQAEIWYSALF